MNKISTFLLMIVGEVLICMGAFLLLDDIEPTNLLVLNIVALSMIYLLVFSSSFDLFNDISMEGSSTSGLGLTLYGILFYSVLSICCIVASYVWRWELLTAILAQGAALFVLFLFAILSNNVTNNVEQSISTIESRKDSLMYAAELLGRVELQVKINSERPYRAHDVDMLKEQLRYVTFSDRPSAQELDSKLITAIDELYHLSNQKADDAGEWVGVVERCNTIIKLRKQQL